MALSEKLSDVIYNDIEGKIRALVDTELGDHLADYATVGDLDSAEEDLNEHLASVHYEMALRDRSPYEVVNAWVEGITPDGNPENPIDERLQELTHKGNVCVFFPPGEYYIDSYEVQADNVELHGFNAVLKSTPEKRVKRIISMDEKQNHFTFKGFVLDAGDELGPSVRMWGKNWRLEDIVLRGDWGVRKARGEDGYPDLMRRDLDGVSVFNLCVSDENGDGYIKDVYAPSGIPVDARDNRRFVYIHNKGDRSHYGTMHVERLYAENWAENVWYGTYALGPVNFTDCYFKNCPIGIRVANSTFTRCTVIKDGPSPGQRESLVGPNSWNRVRGMWFQGGDSGWDPARNSTVVVDDCDFWFEEYEGHDSKNDLAAPILLGPPSSKTRITNTRIYNNQSRWPAILLDARKWAYHPNRIPNLELELEDVHITHNGDKPAIGLNRPRDEITFDSVRTSGAIKSAQVCSEDWFGREFNQGDYVNAEPEQASKDLRMRPLPGDGVTPNARDMV